MPTATVTRIESGSGHWYRKTNPSLQLNDIEWRIYRALHAEMSGSPQVIWEAPTRILVEDVGTTFADIFNSPRCMELASLDILYKTIEARVKVNDIVNRTLSEEDKTFLTAMQKRKLLASVKKREPTVTEEDIAKHYWAHRMMNALDIYDEKFKEVYTETVGSRIDALLGKYGQWRTDNYIRNNVVTREGFVIPFDFNSIRYGLQQMDTATVAALYVTGGPLAIATTSEQRAEVFRKIRESEGLEDDPEYREAYLLSSIHANGIIAGYRLQECKKWKDEILKDFKEKDGVYGEKYLAFRRAYDEIDTYQTAAVQPIYLLRNGDNLADFNLIGETITHNTFGQRMLTMMDIPNPVQVTGNRYIRLELENIQR
jgi:hypothetical protein